MRTPDANQSSMFSYVGPEDRVPKDHPLRKIAEITNVILREMSRRFDSIYSITGRASIPPERLLRALLLQILYSVRSERQLIEQLDYNILFRWFVGLNMDERIWHVTSFSKNRDRLLEGDIAREFFDRIRRFAEIKELMSAEHFTVDGTLLEAWASQKSFVPKDDDQPRGGKGSRNQSVDFHGTERRNETHHSITDPDARLYRKGNTGAKLSYMQHALTENRNGLIVDVRVSHAHGKAERQAALDMIDKLPGHRRITLGADKGYDTTDFVSELREMNVSAHVAANDNRRGGSAIDGRTTRHESYRISQRKRKRVEEVFGWEKTVGGLRKLRHRGIELVTQVVTFTSAAYNLVRISKLCAS